MLRTALIALSLIFAACAPETAPEGSYIAGAPAASGATCVPAEETTSDTARIIADTIVCGELADGQVDTFTVVNTSAVGRELHLETFGGELGCLGDTDIIVRDQLTGGAVITFDDELGIGPCAWVTIFIEARQAVFVDVTGEPGPYQLAVEIFDL
jgi:hypothetical protein